MVEIGVFYKCKSLKRVEFSEGLKRICDDAFFGSGLESVEFPTSLRAVSRGAFATCESLRTVVLNEGLEVLGVGQKTDEEQPEGEVFFGSGIESVKIPSTLKVIEAKTFFKCESLKRVEFSEGLETIRSDAFLASGIEDVILPSSVRVICGLAFAMCRHLRSVRLNEGLEVLGAGQRYRGDTCAGYVFVGSAIESLTVPAEVKRIERAALDKCETIKRIEFREGREMLGMGEEGSEIWNTLFRDCGV